MMDTEAMVRFTFESLGHKSFLSLVFVFVICLVNYLIILYVKRNERKELDQVQDFLFHGAGSRFYRVDSLL